MPDTFVPLVARKKLLGGTAETTKGTAESTSAAFSASSFYDLKMEPVDFFGQGKRMPHGHYFGNTDAVKGTTIGKLTFKMHIRHGDCFKSLLSACGLFASSVTLTKVTSILSNHSTFTFVLWEDGRRKSIKGASGNCKIILENGKPAVAEFEFTGIWIAPIAEAMPSQSPINTTTYVCTGLTASIVSAGTTARFSKCEFDLGNTVDPLESMGATGGIAYFIVGEREPMMSIDTEARLVGDLDAYGLFLAGTTAALSFALSDGTNTLTFAAPRAQRINMTDESRGTKLVDAMEMQLNASSSGDDDFTVTSSS